jgi:hypothetical protein
MSHTLSGKYATPLSLEPRRSRQLGVFVATVHGSAMLVLPLTGLPLLVTIAIALAVAGSLLRTWRTHVSLTGPVAIHRLRWGEGNDWQLTRQGGTTLHTSLQPRVFIHPRLVILRFRQSPWRTDSVLLTSDRLGPDIFRKLRVRLLTEIRQLAGPASS